MSNKKKIWYLIKFFNEKDHAEQFMNGDLYLNRLSFFKSIEENSYEGRKDTNEAVSHWWQPDDLIIKLNAPGIGEIEITKKDLAAPVSMSFNMHNNFHIFCMYAMWTNGFECIDGKIDYAKEDSEKLKMQLIIDKQCFNFGKHAVIVPAVQFLELAKIALIHTEKKCRAKLVNYFDGDKFHGKFDEIDIPFNKLKEYSYQNEFRICIDNQTKGNDPYILSIGNLKGISVLVDSSKLNDIFRIDSIEI